MPVWALPALVWSLPACAHGFGGNGWLHPLTGPDHMLAMVAVGAWSAQLGGRAVAAVPGAFVLAMAAGGAAGFAGWVPAGTEGAIALSVILLGAAIAAARPLAWPVAAFAVMLFGLAHGVAHGGEMPRSEDPLGYALGFLVTTAGLHALGLVGGLLVLERPGGARTLRLLGAAATVAGIGIAVPLA